MISLLLAVVALAHPAADERPIPKGCEDVPQLFRRSAALSAESRMLEAEQEIQKASRCGADPAEVQLALADIAVRDDRADYALSLLEQISSAEHASVHVVRSDALAAQGRVSDAADSRLIAIARLPKWSPDLLIRTAQLLEDAGRLEEALVVVDEGMAMVPAASLQFETIRLAAQINPERALARLDDLPTTAIWLQKRGEILAELGREHDARKTLTEALGLAAEGRSSRRQREQIASLTLAIESLNP